MIRVCLVEDQTIVRQGLRTLLDLVDDIEVVAEAVDGEDAVRRIPDIAPDVVLLDMRMPKLDGLGVLNQLGAQDRLPPTIILTTFDDDGTVLEGIRAGAKGFLLKDVSLDQLTGAIRRGRRRHDDSARRDGTRPEGAGGPWPATSPVLTLPIH